MVGHLLKTNGAITINNLRQSQNYKGLAIFELAVKIWQLFDF